MAVLAAPSARVDDDDGTPISGGKLRVYDINTTTLSDVFSDEAMATPLTNPVVADANGFLPVIFAAQGTYDLQYLDASSAELAGQEYNDWPTVGGSTANTIGADLSGARVRIDGGDIGDGTTGVRINAGDPDPDVVGGNLRLGGWDGTQADKIWIDGAVVNVAEPKSFEEDGKRLSTLLQTAASSFTASASVAVPLTNDPVGTRCFRITFFDLVFSSAVAVIWLRLAYDGVPTLLSGASDYAYGVVNNTGGGLVEQTSAGASQIRIGPTSSSAAAHPLGIDCTVLTPNAAPGDTLVWGRLLGFGLNTGGVLGNYMFEGAGLGAHGRATHIALVPSTGTVSGKYRIEQLRGYGE